MRKVRWGVLGVAKIGVTKVIPAMQQGQLSEVTAIASRNLDKAEKTAGELGIGKAYGRYEDLLADPNVDAIYNPLPNHLHVPWSERAAEAGKHILCEKPIALSAGECRKLIETCDKAGVKAGEAFMVHTHPQWVRAKQIVDSGEIGELRAMMVAFNYFNRDAANVRNVAHYGGGGLLDIGCYPIHTSRMIFGQEPSRVSAILENDADFQVDYLSSAMLDYGGRHVSFSCSTQAVPYQRAQIFGTKGRIEIEIPFNAPPDRECRLFIDSGKDVFGSGIRVEELPVCNQYTIQGDEFSRAILENKPVSVSLGDALHNMLVIDAIAQAAREKTWINVPSA